MATFFQSRHSTLQTLLYFLLTISSLTSSISSLNITQLLTSYPDLSDFNSLLTTTSVADDLNQRSSLTLLAVPNSYLRNSDLTRHPSSPYSSIADVIRYHVLLQYLSWSDLHQIPASGKLITTLYQTTGRAPSNFGSVNITFSPSDDVVLVQPPVSYSSSNATILSLIKTLPYNVSIFTVNSLVIPYGFDLMASETRPPLGLNITKALIDGHNFNVAASLLMASGVVEEFESDEGGAGITLFVPTDDAFADVSTTEKLQSLPADRKAVVLKFHVLHSYYPLGSLQSIVNPVQPTLATEDMGAGSFTLNISRVNGSVAIDTGIVQASVTQTVFDQKPVAIFGISRVLLPREIFGRNPIMNTKPVVEAPAPEISLSPANSPGQPSHLSSPPGFRGDMNSSAAVRGGESFIFSGTCIVMMLLYLIV